MVQNVGLWMFFFRKNHRIGSSIKPSEKDDTSASRTACAGGGHRLGSLWASGVSFSLPTLLWVSLKPLCLGLRLEGVSEKLQGGLRLRFLDHRSMGCRFPGLTQVACPAGNWALVCLARQQPSSGLLAEKKSAAYFLSLFFLTFAL